MGKISKNFQPSHRLPSHGRVYSYSCAAIVAAALVVAVSYTVINNVFFNLHELEYVVAEPKPDDSELHGIPVEYLGTLEVVSVIDGNTIRVRKDDKEIDIHLDSIDIPEMDQPYSEESKKALGNLVMGKRVQIFKTGTDKYGRTLAFLVVDGLDVNREMLRLGYAWHYKEYSNSFMLASDESDAQRNRRGLWAGENAVPPWLWRSGQYDVVELHVDLSPGELKEIIQDYVRSGYSIDLATICEHQTFFPSKEKKGTECIVSGVTNLLPGKNPIKMGQRICLFPRTNGKEVVLIKCAARNWLPTDYVDRIKFLVMNK